jgi:flagellar FliL protein
MSDDEDVPVKNGKKRLLVILAAVLLIMAGAGGAWFFLMAGNQDPAAGSAAETVAAAPQQAPVQYLELTPAFIVNFPHQGRQRFMQATITVMSRDAEALAAVTQHMPVIRHNLINLLSAQLILVFENPQGIERLRQMATDEVNQVLMREIGREGIEELLFTNFVMQ